MKIEIKTAMNTMFKTKAIIIAVAFALATSLLGVPSTKALAETITSDQEWSVNFTNNAEMVCNFTYEDIEELTGNIQPGDTAEMAVTITNSNSTATTWYMRNNVINSLEEAAASAKGGAYTYDLSYTGPDGQTIQLFSSDTVGGDESAGSASGMHEATVATEDYFALGQLNQGQSGLVKLSVSLDGETQGNAYQRTMADLSMDFAVELNNGANRNDRNFASGITLAKSGDKVMEMVPVFIACAIGGLIILIIALLLKNRRDKNEEEGVR